ncbi:MAG: hypothetical protein J7562_11295 [Agrobacterium tumefaciens]|nr:hypothetical protein [Agrobacterium tumefaciens]
MVIFPSMREKDADEQHAFKAAEAEGTSAVRHSFLLRLGRQARRCGAVFSMIHRFRLPDEIIIEMPPGKLRKRRDQAHEGERMKPAALSSSGALARSVPNSVITFACPGRFAPGLPAHSSK